MSLAVDNPIINGPFDEPIRYWDYREGQPILVEGRRPAGYYLKARTRGPQNLLLPAGSCRNPHLANRSFPRGVRAVNHHGEFGRWAFRLCRDAHNLKEVLTSE